MQALRAALFGIALSGCAHAVAMGPVVPITIDPRGEWTQEELYDLTWTQDSWNKACGVTFFGPGGRVLMAHKSSTIYQDKLALGGPALGILLYTRTPDSMRYAVLQHELGHTLGLTHQPSGVMRGAVDVQANISQDDCEHALEASGWVGRTVPYADDIDFWKRILEIESQ